MSRRTPRSLLNVDDVRVNAVLIILGIRLADAVEAFVARPGHHVRRDDPRFVHIRRRVTAGLRELRCGGVTLSFPEIARLVGTTGHSTVIGRCQTVRRLGLLSDTEIMALRRGGAVEPGDRRTA